MNQAPARRSLIRRDAPWVLVIVVTAGLIALHAGPHKEYSHPAPPAKKNHAAYITPRPKPFDEEMQAAKIVAEFRGKDVDVANCDVSGFGWEKMTPAIPKLGADGKMRVIEVSLFGDLQEKGDVSVPRGRPYRYVLFGPEANFILIDLEQRADGSRVFGLAPYDG